MLPKATDDAGVLEGAAPTSNNMMFVHEVHNTRRKTPPKWRGFFCVCVV